MLLLLPLTKVATHLFAEDSGRVSESRWWHEEIAMTGDSKWGGSLQGTATQTTDLSSKELRVV